MNQEYAIPNKDEVKALLAITLNDKIVPTQTIGDLLGIKWVDSLLPKIKGEPAWGYEGLKTFFMNHEIDAKDTLEEALRKLK